MAGRGEDIPVAPPAPSPDGVTREVHLGANGGARWATSLLRTLAAHGVHQHPQVDGGSDDGRRQEDAVKVNAAAGLRAFTVVAFPNWMFDEGLLEERKPVTVRTVVESKPVDSLPPGSLYLPSDHEECPECPNHVRIPFPATRKLKVGDTVIPVRVENEESPLVPFDCVE